MRRRTGLQTRDVSPGEWITIDPGFQPGVEPHTVTVGGVPQPAGVSYGLIMVRCPQLTPGRYQVQLDGGDVWPIVVKGA